MVSQKAREGWAVALDAERSFIFRFVCFVKSLFSYSLSSRHSLGPALCQRLCEALENQRWERQNSFSYWALNVTNLFEGPRVVEKNQNNGGTEETGQAACCVRIEATWGKGRRCRRLLSPQPLSSCLVDEAQYGLHGDGLGSNSLEPNRRDLDTHEDTRDTRQNITSVSRKTRVLRSFRKG